MDYKTYGKEFHKRDSACRFMQPFIFATEFRDDKRFARYVAKVKNACDRVAREYFDLSAVYGRDDAVQLVLHELKTIAVNKWFERKTEVSENDIENDDIDIANENDKCNNTYSDGQQDEMDEDTMKFLMKHQMQQIGLEDDIDIVDEIDKNFSHLHDYHFEDVNMDAMWDEIMMIFLEYDLLMDIKAGKNRLDVSKEQIENTIQEERAIMSNYNAMQSVIDSELVECCFEYLHYRIAEENSAINYDNFTIHGLPNGDGEVLWIISNVIDRTAYNMLNRVREENSIGLNERSAVALYKKEKDEAVEDKEAIEEELREEREKTFALRKKLEGIEDAKEKEFADLKAENQDLYYEKSKLEKKAAALEAECERLKMLIAEMQERNDADDEDALSDSCDIDTSKVDVNKRYLFVMDANPYGKEQILVAFPNSKIVGTYVEFNQSSVDMVICITSRVKHSVYNSTKDYCKSKDVPFVHCMQTNPEMIKRAIVEFEKK